MTAVSVADIISAVDEPLDATSCGGKGNCHDNHPCMTHNLWTKLNERMYEYLHSVNLDELVRQQHGTPCAESIVAVTAGSRQSRRIPVMASA
jgi:Rrf2 family iron-sulfur cluster assembly transcriptional regulator